MHELTANLSRTLDAPYAIVTVYLTFTSRMPPKFVIRQNYNKDTNTYEPDRALIPCVLMPYVSVSDPEGVMSGIRDITGA